VMFSLMCVLVFSSVPVAKQAKDPICIPMGNIELKAPSTVTAGRP
jgi:hypothetical protein